MTKRARRTIFHIFIIAVSIGLAVFLAKLGIFEKFILTSPSNLIIGSFIAGIFFPIFLTFAPAAVAFFAIAQHAPSIWPVALAAGAGSVLGDLLIFRFLRFGLDSDIMYFFNRWSRGIFRQAVKNPVFSFFAKVFGALIIMSPFPDELGLFLMDLGHIKVPSLIILAFLLDTVGFILLGLVARGLTV